MEKWLPVDDWPGYEVSSFGQVRQGSTVLKQTLRPEGYLVVGLWQSSPRKKVTARVNRLVALAFHKDTYFEGAYCLHKDHNRANNHEGNLYWGTQARNIQDMVEACRVTRSTAKLDWDKVREIRRRAALGEKGSVLGREMGVNTQTVNCVIRGETWKEPPGGLDN